MDLFFCLTLDTATSSETLFFDELDEGGEENKLTPKLDQMKKKSEGRIEDAVRPSFVWEQTIGFKD